MTASAERPTPADRTPTAPPGETNDVKSASPGPPDRRFSIAGDDDAADAVGDEADEPSAGAASAASILASVAARGAVARAAAGHAPAADRRFSIDGDDEDEEEVWKRGAAGASAHPAALAVGAATWKLASVAPCPSGQQQQHQHQQQHHPQQQRWLSRRLGFALTAIVSAAMLLLGAARLALIFL